MSSNVMSANKIVLQVFNFVNNMKTRWWKEGFMIFIVGLEGNWLAY